MYAIFVVHNLKQVQTLSFSVWQVFIFGINAWFVGKDCNSSYFFLITAKSKTGKLHI